MRDLRVYYLASPEVLSGHLYHFRLFSPEPGAQQLAFTYPPFAALVFLPLSALPWRLALVVWHVLSLGAAALLVRTSFRLLPREPRLPDGSPRRAHVALWTAAVLWLEPVQHGLGLGQASLLVATLALVSTTRRHSVLAGAGVGVAAGIKLTPAAFGIYLLARRKRAAACSAALVFLGTVVLAGLTLPKQSLQFWLHHVMDTGRVGPTGSVENQSLRGCLTRLFGHDPGLVEPWWWVTLLLFAALTGTALRTASRHGDALALLTAVQLLALLACPISWSHHWIWSVAAMVWLAHGPARTTRLSRVSLACWALAAGGWLVQVLGQVEDTATATATAPGAPLPIALTACAYPACAALTLAAIARTPSRPRVTRPEQLRAGTSGPRQAPLE
ncbi:glycosyltransferase 87 family protein [Streptomyces rectiverticillatus]|uniref:glycosyltransferase 87 family protein n=1 Tax=Streptomyces rectiverticillatus TaxID=173860 RepID=UPI0015C3AFFB|nr:glycosyltransferase 87 family protein [Streptomyces rectiverticillatus]